MPIQRGVLVYYSQKSLFEDRPAALFGAEPYSACVYWFYVAGIMDDRKMELYAFEMFTFCNALVYL
uniref:Uncharacterized protein n=1 Tax=Anguilla anguilla TaxID=7936 RepID=A0A0E9W874_ANGAN